MAVMDDEAAGKEFFGLPVVSLADGIRSGYQGVILTSLKKGDLLRARLRQLGVDGDMVFSGADDGSAGTDRATGLPYIDSIDNKEAL